MIPPTNLERGIPQNTRVDSIMSMFSSSSSSITNNIPVIIAVSQEDMTGLHMHIYHGRSTLANAARGNPWDTAPGPSASLFPPARPEAAEAAPSGDPAPGVSTKPLPATPSHFRLGEDALPWSAWAWPADAEHHGSGAEGPYTSQPTTVPISPGLRSGDDPQRVRELESLSAAMVTVDNGFENQWWYQGPRETTAWWPRDQEEPSRLSLADDLLFSCSSSAMEPADCAAVDDWHGPPYSDESPLFDGIVSPVSTASPARPLQRSMTTRSEELFIMSEGQ
ncbi:hypothetical protein KJ359_011185 [Pestalotiopsis sp. 9143b]|nr:hypothetical protein KJ359_011185 [Pestalotiopsis sp. 9143b]